MKRKFTIETEDFCFSGFSSVSAADALKKLIVSGKAFTLYELREHSDGRRTVKEWHEVDFNNAYDLAVLPVSIKRVLKRGKTI